MNRTLISADAKVAPLESCLLVDYRLSSRSQLKEHIATTEIFDRVHEPGSLTIGLELVNKQRVETCIFGPSVKAEKIQDFIISTQISGESMKCAFLVFQQRDRQEEIKGAHAIVDFPCSQPLFNVGLVQALAHSNGGTLPTSKRIDPRTGKPVDLKARLARLEFPIKKTQSHEISSAENEPWPRALIDVVQVNSPILFELLLSVHPFNLKFRPDGVASEFTMNVVRGLIEEAFGGTDHVPSMDRFKKVLEGFLYAWVKRGTLQGRAAADFVLRRDIRNCLQTD